MRDILSFSFYGETIRQRELKEYDNLQGVEPRSERGVTFGSKARTPNYFAQLALGSSKVVFSF